jgi:SAM-dependent methyltransferase
MAGTVAAFDSHAARYDELWTRAPAGRLQREAVWRNVSDLFRAPQHVLDLGCGTGEDSRWLRQRGIEVTSIDASPAMIAEALRHNPEARVLRIEELESLPGPFSGALSNFGVVNCLASPENLRDSLIARLTPGAHFALCVMGRFCLWETVWYSLRGQFRKATRRWNGQAQAQSFGIAVSYHSVARLRRAFAPGFQLIRVTGIGIAVPPSYVRLPHTWFGFLGWIDRQTERIPFMAAIADHRLLIFVRR